jgi:transposase-like protein
MGALVRGADARYIARVPSRFRCRSFCRTRRRQRTPCRKSRRRTYITAGGVTLRRVGVGRVAVGRTAGGRMAVR